MIRVSQCCVQRVGWRALRFLGAARFLGLELRLVVRFLAKVCGLFGGLRGESFYKGWSCVVAFFGEGFLG